ncbi:Tyrosine-protein kinase Fer [Toxocara canis]|uniref:Tyrosine-protein kinase n=1 Tax=Toxocara canis TaxID=6265 RepID=A0A0B2UXP6_TOXCA|nr:Tyrosine-protein kinase Fer [Toxocara canis]
MVQFEGRCEIFKRSRASERSGKTLQSARTQGSCQDKSTSTRSRSISNASRSRTGRTRQTKSSALSVSKAAAKTAAMKEMRLKEEEFAKNAGNALQMNEWYHGLMPREEIEEMLHDDGDFIVRRTEVGGKTRLVVSVMNKRRIRHILLMFSDGKWSLRNMKMVSITALILEHVKLKVPVQGDGTILTHPVPRPDYYILHDHVVIKDQIGSGAFGDVHVGALKKADGSMVDVAIKRLKGLMTKRQRSVFMKAHTLEAKIMRRFNHPNIVNLLGVAPQEDPVMIILELCPNGSLNKKLKCNPTIPVSKLVAYATDAARGMVYLSTNTVIHRDIAARNCLIGKNDEAKISDFGLSVADQDTISVDKLRQMPVRWLSPETLRLGQFSTKTDVWSFGVMLWEIFSRCKTDPYPGLTNMQARGKILSRETPMTPPEGTPQTISTVMMLCFTQEPANRPNFVELFKILAPNEKIQEGERTTRA